MRSGSDEPYVSVRLIWPFMRAIEADGIVPPLLAEQGLGSIDLANADARVPRRASMRLLACVVAHRNDATLGLRAAELFSASDLGVLEYAARSCATLRDATRCAMRYIRLLHEAASLSLEERDEVAILHFRSLDGLVQEPAANDFEVAVFVGLARRYTGAEHERPFEIHLAHAVPSSESEYERVFGCAVRMSMPHNAIVFPRRQLALPLLHADATLHNLLDRNIAEMLARQPQSSGISARARALMRADLSTGRATLEHIAKSLAMSATTLRRHLEDEGTRYRELLDHVRREQAERYLADVTLTFDDIAFLLGYAHSNNLFRACRRWFNGQTPGQVRAQLRKSLAPH